MVRAARIVKRFQKKSSERITKNEISIVIPVKDNQKGIDNYAIYNAGLGFFTGAGQFMGKKPPIVFFAALYDDTTILEDIRAIATDQEALENRSFQADSQIRAGKNVVLWGEDSFNEMHNYFSDL